MRGGVTRGQSIDDGAMVGNRSSWARVVMLEAMIRVSTIVSMSPSF